MPMFHINSAGEPGRCAATIGNCPFGSPAEHYLTPAEARSAYEALRGDVFIPPFAKATLTVESLDEKLLAQALRIAEASTLAEIHEIEAETAPIALIREKLINGKEARLEPPD